MKQTRLTKTQQEVMNRFDEGQRIAIFQTRRQSGEALFWVRETSEGWIIVEKALYPQLRRLFWDGKISTQNTDQVVRGEGLNLNRYANTDDLHREGVIGY